MSLWKDTKYRIRRAWLSLISKTWLVFFIATALLFYGKIDGWMWLAAAGVATGSSAYQKINGVTPDLPTLAPPAGGTVD